MAQVYYQLRYAIPIFFIIWATAILPDNRYAIRLRGRLVSLFLPGRPKGLELGRDVTLLNVDRLEIGAEVYLAKGVWLNAIGGISIGNEVTVSPYVVISSSRHAFVNGSTRRAGSFLAPVSIGRGSWLASHVTVNAGSNIGEGVLVGANSFVKGTLDSHSVYAGVPVNKVGARQDRAGEVFTAR